MNERDLLRHHTDMDSIAPDILIGIYAEPVTATAQQCDVALEAGIRNKVECRVILRIGVVAPCAAPLNAGIAAGPGHRRTAGRELEADAGHDRLELGILVRPLRNHDECRRRGT